MDWYEQLMFKMFHIMSMLRIEKILRIDRLFFVGGTTYPFTDYFKGLERVEAVRQIFGEKTEETLRNLKVRFSLVGYMGVSNLDGHLIVNSRYLNKGDKIDIYLDLIHELVHVRQFIEGKELFDTAFSYVERPTEVEAYRHAVEEARKLGLSDKRICQYLKTEWMSNEDLKTLTKTLKVKCV